MELSDGSGGRRCRGVVVEGMSIPYATARSGHGARAEIIKILRHFGCESVGFLDEFEAHSLVLAFVWRGRQIQLRAMAEGWANVYLHEHPWTTRKRVSRQEWEEAALRQGMIAVNSILRDWVKGQVTAVETGILSFEHVFLPFMLTADGTPVIDSVRKMLPRPDGDE